MKFPHQENYHTVELRNLERGVVGGIYLHTDLYDEVEAAEIAAMLTRVHDSWWRRRQFGHQNLDRYTMKIQ